MRETTAVEPSPKIKPTRLKLKRPISNQTSAPIMVNVNAIIVVIFIIPSAYIICKAEKIIT